MILKLIITFFGFISGFLLLITSNTLNFWMSKEGFSNETIGLFSLVCAPYAINFIWAPFFDRVHPYFINLNVHFRIKWLIILYCAGFITCSMIAYSGMKNLSVICIFSLILSVINSSQDIILSAYRAEYTPSDSIAASSGFYIFGYRMGMIVSGPLAIYASKYISFTIEYQLFALMYLLFLCSVVAIDYMSATYDRIPKTESAEYNLKDIFQNIGDFKFIASLLIFLLLYKSGDNLISAMINPYLLHLGFQENQIALAGKLSGIIGAAVGGIIASQFMHQNNITQSLKWFGILHAISHIGYIILARCAPSSLALFTVTIFDSVTGGMAMSSYIALITSLCCGRFKTTQYAIFTAMMGLSRAVLPSASGYIVSTCSWDIFFGISIIMIVPAIALLKMINIPDKEIR